MKIRPEDTTDVSVISEIHYTAFKNHPQHEPGAEPVEHRIVERLRDSGELALSLVAEINGNAIGHIALSPAVVGEEDEGWFLLGPIGVLPAHQKKGVGSALVQAAMDRMREQGTLGIVLVGPPEYYGRFGFKSLESLTYPGVPSQYVLAVSFGGTAPGGDIKAHDAFG
ncbi:MAG: N-acetyltransferase [Cyanobacteria bacterium SBC]|nr:N-acetyltransferase [Cyanobacteria bacterium SBC]